MSPSFPKHRFFVEDNAADHLTGYQPVRAVSSSTISKLRAMDSGVSTTMVVTGTGEPLK